MDVNKNGDRPERILGLDANTEAEHFHANYNRRQFLHVRSVSFSCRTRDKAPNHSLEFASNIRAFLLGDPAFMTVLEATSKEVSASDEKHVFNTLYRQLYGDPAEYSKLDKVEQERRRAQVAVMFIGSSPEERQELLGLDLAVSCKLRGYEKELFFLKTCVSSHGAAWWVGRCCYHAMYEVKNAEPLEFHALLSLVSFKPSFPPFA